MNPPKPKPNPSHLAGGTQSATFQPADLPAFLTTHPPGTKLSLEILPNGAIAVADTTPKTKTQLIDETYPHLKGHGITLSNAAKKYGVPRATVENWVYGSGDVHFTDETCYPKLVDEAEVALCSDIYKERQKTRTAGLPYFDSAGRLITTVKRPLSTRPAYLRQKNKTA